MDLAAEPAEVWAQAYMTKNHLLPLADLWVGTGGFIAVQAATQ